MCPKYACGRSGLDKDAPANACLRSTRKRNAPSRRIGDFQRIECRREYRFSMDAGLVVLLSSPCTQDAAAAAYASSVPSCFFRHLSVFLRALFSVTRLGQRLRTEDMTDPETANRMYAEVFRGASPDYPLLSRMKDKVFLMAFGSMTKDYDEGYPLVEGLVRCTHQALDGFLRNTTPAMPPSTAEAKLTVVCREGRVQPNMKKALLAALKRSIFGTRPSPTALASVGCGSCPAVPFFACPCYQSY